MEILSLFNENISAYVVLNCEGRWKDGHELNRNEFEWR